MGLADIFTTNKCFCFIYKKNFSTKFQRSKIAFFSINVDFRYFSKESKFLISSSNYEGVINWQRTNTNVNHDSKHNNMAEDQQMTLGLKMSKQQRKCSTDFKPVVKVKKKFHTVTPNFERVRISAWILRDPSCDLKYSKTKCLSDIPSRPKISICAGIAQSAQWLCAGGWLRCVKVLDNISFSEPHNL